MVDQLDENFSSANKVMKIQKKKKKIKNWLCMFDACAHACAQRPGYLCIKKIIGINNLLR
jgi:hypothetical protein